MATAPPTINALPAPPDPNDRSTFNARAYPWSVAQQTLATEANAVAANVFTNASEAASSANSAAISVLDAIAQVTLANAAASSAEATAGATQWVSGTTYAVGDCVWSPINQQTYRRKVAGAGATDPGADTANWTQVVGGSSKILRSARTSNAQLTTADNGKLIDITSGTFTQTFAAATTLGDGWYCYIKNSGTGDITLDPNASETIDGLTSYVMYPGEVRLVQCDWTALRTIVLNAFYKVFTASGTFTRPPGYTGFNGLLWAAGGSGAKDSTFVFGGGGGACAPLDLPWGAVSATETITIGAGSAASSTTTGNDGGNSSFGSLLTAYGGKGGGTGGLSGTGGSAIYQTAGASPVFSGANPGTDFVSQYGGGAGAALTGRGRTVYGGGGGAAINSSMVQPLYVTTVYGGAGGAGGDATNGSDGAAPGGGGGSTRTGTQSGAGARGELRIWGVI